MLNFLRISIVSTLAFAAIALPSVGTPETVSATEPKQWSVERENVMSNTPYRLLNVHRDQYLAYRATDPGLHVYWSPGGSTVYGGTWQLIKKDAAQNVRDHRARAIVNGETIAIYSPYPAYETTRGTRKGMYLTYSGSSSTGRLEWTRVVEKAIEWRIDLDPATRRLSLYNARKGDYLVYDAGPRIGWLRSQPGQGAVHDASVTMVAKPPVQGYVPFLGYFGGGVNFKAVLIEVRNPDQLGGPTLRFLKPNHSSNECANPDAVIVLAPGAMLTAADMKTLYGSATPSLQTQIPFVACVAGTNASTVFVNIKYRDV